MEKFHAAEIKVIPVVPSVKLAKRVEEAGVDAMVIEGMEANNFDYAAVKAKGLQRTEGKEYVVNDGDVIEFLFNV